MSTRLRIAAGLRGLVLACVLFAIGGGTTPYAEAADPETLSFVAPGMNQAELQSVLGPPTYIQVRGLRQAWQYCPRRIRIRLLDELLRREEDLFVTVWFDNGRVRHMRALPNPHTVLCEDYLAAFRWEDDIDGGFGGGRFGDFGGGGMGGGSFK